MTKGRIKQSIVFWCFNTAGEEWNIEKTSQVATELGCVSVEIVEPAEWHTLKKHNLVCALAPNGMPGAPFVKGFNNPRYHDEVITRAKESIDASADAGFHRAADVQLGCDGWQVFVDGKVSEDLVFPAAEPGALHLAIFGEGGTRGNSQ